MEKQIQEGQGEVWVLRKKACRVAVSRHSCSDGGSLVRNSVHPVKPLCARCVRCVRQNPLLCVLCGQNQCLSAFILSKKWPVSLTHELRLGDWEASALRGSVHIFFVRVARRGNEHEKAFDWLDSIGDFEFLA